MSFQVRCGLSVSSLEKEVLVSYMPMLECGGVNEEGHGNRHLYREATVGLQV